MVQIETSVSQVTGLANFNVYNDNVLIISYDYHQNTQLINISALLIDLEMPLNDYVKNVGILDSWTQDIQSNFALSANDHLTTSRNYEYDFANHFRRATCLIDGNQFKVRYNYNNKKIIVKARNAFIFNFSQLSYFTKCHKDFSTKNDLF